MTLIDKVEFDITKECVYIDTRSILRIILITYCELNKEPTLNYSLVKRIISLINAYYCHLLDKNLFYELTVLYLNESSMNPSHLNGIIPLNEDINLIIKIFLNKLEKDEISNLYKQDNYPYNILNKYLSEYLVSILGGLKYEK